jgi:hypothetical protein
MRCRTPEFRLSFPKLFKPEGFNGSEPKFSIVMLFPKASKIDALKRAVAAAAVDKWGPDKSKWPPNMRWPFKDGDTKGDLTGYAGHIAVSASNKMAPGIVNQRVERLSEKNSNTAEIYGGCYAHADIRAFAYSKLGNNGVSFSLENVQKTRDGEPFSGRKAPEQVFQVIASDEDDETLGDTAAVDMDFPF